MSQHAGAIIAEAAQCSTRVRTIRIDVNGDADNAVAHPGARGERYNQGLSWRCAGSVKAELIRDGVPADAIDISGRGESHLPCRLSPAPASRRGVVSKSLFWP